MDDLNEKKPWSDTIKWAYDSARQREAIYKQTLQNIAANKEAQQHFQQFKPSSVETQLSSYAWRKARWMVDKGQNEWCMEYRGLEIPLAAQQCLGNIQQKKLFDKQCLWRAEMFQHPAIETTADFMYWEHNILNCPFIEPVSEDDVALYIQFLTEYLGEDLAFLGSWQDYNTYNSSHATLSKLMQENDDSEAATDEDEDKEEMYEDEDEDNYGEEEGEQPGSLMPPWYQFVNQHRGDGHYLLLPDKRQEKEWFYSRKGHTELIDKAKEKQKTEPTDKRPLLSIYTKEEIEYFINQFEENPGEVLSAYNVHEKMYSDPEEEGMYWVNEAWEDLDDCFEPFPIAAGITDWKKALIKTAKQWTNTKLTRALPMHYDEYLFRRSAGIAGAFDTSQEASYRRMADSQKETILRGRELSGEPRDLNF